MFAQTSSVDNPKGPFIIVSVVESTNNYAMAKLHAGMVEAGTCFQAVQQTSGKGQRGRQWQSEAGQNITLSIVLHPSHHKSYPFTESALLAIICYDFIKELSVENVSVKWPNDLYVGDRKAAGILVENTYRGTEKIASVAGIGMNINQTSFSSGADKAISISQVTGKNYEVCTLGRMLHRRVLDTMHESSKLTDAQIMEMYNSRLYKKGSEVKFKMGPVYFSSTIKEVSLSGELLTKDTLERNFAVGDVEFV